MSISYCLLLLSSLNFWLDGLYKNCIYDKCLTSIRMWLYNSNTGSLSMHKRIKPKTTDIDRASLNRHISPFSMQWFGNISASRITTENDSSFPWLWSLSLWWRHNDHDSVSNHQPDECLLNRLFRRTSKKTPKLRVTGLCVGNSPGPVNSPHKGPVTRKMFPFDDVIMMTTAS